MFLEKTQNFAVINFVYKNHKAVIKNYRVPFYYLFPIYGYP